MLAIEEIPYDIKQNKGKDNIIQINDFLFVLLSLIFLVFDSARSFIRILKKGTIFKIT